MALKKTIDEQIKQAMLSKDKDRLRVLRAIKSQILLAETEKGAQEELTPDKEIALLTKGAKQRRDSAEMYAQQNRQDLADVELYDLQVIEEFLPKQLSDEELQIAVKDLIAKAGVEGPKAMGQVMGLASKELAGKAEGKRISEVVKSLLNA